MDRVDDVGAVVWRTLAMAQIARLVGFGLLLSATLPILMANGEQSTGGEKSGRESRITVGGPLVPDAKTAIKLAEAILPTVYGDGVLSERPFEASATSDRWIVEGTLHGGPYARGGVAYIEIRKSDAKVLAIHHGK